MDMPNSVALDTVRAVVSDDHNAEAGEAALRAIITGVSKTGGTQGLMDLATELALKLAEVVERAAVDEELLAADLLDILFLDSADAMTLRPGQ